jgi:N4-gp56 family major capsid protein
MAIQNYGTVASRNLIRAEMELLKHVDNIQVLGKFGAQKEQPKRKTDTIVFRRLKPFNATATEVPNITPTAFLTAEGVTPNANTIDYTDVTVSLNQYAVLYKFSSKAALMYEDDIPGDMTKQVGETLAEVAELVCYGQIKGGTSVIYANGTTLIGVNSAVSLGRLRQAARSMENNRAHRITSAVKPGPNFGTSSVEPAYLVFHHTDCNSDVRDLPGFTRIEDYGTAIKPMHPREIGACEEFRFIPSPLFSPQLAAGAAVAGTGMVSAAGANIDVYPMIITAADAWGHVSLKGHGYSGVSPTLIPHNVKNHANPSGMFGFVGADFWYNAVRLNENWMTRLMVGVTDL